ncbi:hypothetical protein N9L92_04875 [Saprospiraceae bacterium]|nr:hypothetical protein [Saprospiraceae bacterium]
MKVSKCISFTSIFFFVIQLSAQSIFKVDNNTYTYNLNTYEFQDMEDVFIRDINSLREYNSHIKYKSAIRLRTTTRVSGYVTLGFIGLHTLAPFTVNGRYCDTLCNGDVIAIFSFFLLFLFQLLLV